GSLVAYKIRVTGDAGELASDGFGREDIVDAAGDDGASRHAVVFCRFFILGESDAAVSLNLRQAGGSLGTGGRQEDTNGAITLFFRKSAHEMVDGHVHAARLTTRAEL